MSQFNVAGYRPGDQVGQGKVADPHAKDSDHTYKEVVVDMNRNFKRDEGDRVILVSLPKGPCRTAESCKATATGIKVLGRLGMIGGVITLFTSGRTGISPKVALGALGAGLLLSASSIKYSEQAKVLDSIPDLVPPKD